MAAAFVALGILLAASAANALLGVDVAGGDPVLRDWMSSAIGVLVAAIVSLRPLRIHARRRIAV